MAKRQDLDLSPDEIDLKERALNWIDREMDGTGCPFCGWRSTVETPEEGNAFLRGHLVTNHGVKLVVAYQQQTLNPNMRKDDPGATIHERVGVEVVDSYDHYDALFIDPEVRAESKRMGSKLRWLAPERVAQEKARGAKLVPFTNMTAVQGDTADTITKANEMVLVEYPQEIADKRQKVLKDRASSAISKRREEMGIEGQEMAKKTYDAALAQGLSQDVARNLARAIETGSERKLVVSRG